MRRASTARIPLLVAVAAWTAPWASAAQPVQPGFEEAPVEAAPVVPAAPATPAVPALPLVPEPDDVPLKEAPVTASPPPAPERKKTRLRVPGIVVGSCLFAGSYLVTVLAAGSQTSWDSSRMTGAYIPVIGPLLYKYHDPFSQMFLLVSSGAQASGVVALLVGALVPEEVPAAGRVALLPIALSGGGGLMAIGQW